ncbi:MAG: putative sulfate/molybdate transporter [Methanospirillum sp.]|uniref:putative sulfate/molybdate transporter n=1 Tax=Methanospirillum sp. TaxID=45200 RepID=UPI00236977B5|nr:putative sulfate/molybdate transporter [Methanospirillum sp.]MDD1728819.1 putative sulfate/molybdate transporter [Methanospirillum sp.]
MTNHPQVSSDPVPLPLLSGSDIAGSVSNFGTVLPLFFAVSLTSGMSLSLMLLLCGCWYILTGIIYRIPLSVEPLKAVAAISIAGNLSPELIAASGILTGLLFVILGMAGGMNWMQERIPSPVIKGIQLGLGLLLLKSAVLDFGIFDPFFFVICIGVIILFAMIRLRRDVPDLSALAILAIGVGVILHTHGMPLCRLPTLPIVTIPGLSYFMIAGPDLVLPQIPLTIANSILATSLLASELYHHPVSPDRLSITVGAMSLSTSILGGFPLCHGAGGVAAHYRFGARHGSSLVLGGLILIGAATLLTDPIILSSIPKGVFGALLLAVAIELINRGRKSDNLLLSGAMAIIAVPAGMAVAFIAGILFCLLLLIPGRRREKC